MADNQQQQKKQFSVPSRDELIQTIKDLDEDIDHVALNLIKCDFNATENDIRKSFPQFNFIKVKNYNPGSFEVIFEMKIDAINFIRNHYDKKILSRRFFIKMGRQQKQVIEDWTGVGNMPRQFRGPNKPNFNQNKPREPREPRQPRQPRGKRPEGEKTEEQTQEKTAEEKPTSKVEVKPEVKQDVKQQTNTQEQPKKEGKHIPKFENHYKKQDQRKPQQEGGEKRTEGYVKRQGEHRAPRKEETQKVSKKQEGQQAPRKEGEKKEVAHKRQEKVEKKENKPVVKEQAPKQDDGWITVGSSNKNQRRR